MALVTKDLSSLRQLYPGFQIEAGGLRAVSNGQSHFTLLENSSVGQITYPSAGPGGAADQFLTGFEVRGAALPLNVVLLVRDAFRTPRAVHSNGNLGQPMRRLTCRLELPPGSGFCIVCQPRPRVIQVVACGSRPSGTAGNPYLNPGPRQRGVGMGTPTIR
jgi:hypothetical protein